MVEVQEMTGRLHSLLYVSRSLLAPLGDEAQILEIVYDAVEFNAAHGVTGALIATHGYFAQHLEGPEPVIAALMGRIKVDPRHRDVRIIREAPGVARLFDRWSMAYSGPARYFDREIEPAMEASAQTDEHARRLLAHMLEFARYDRLNRG